MKKRLLSLALASVMCLSLIPSTVFAAGGGTVAIDDTNFPDEKFLAYVQTLPGAEDGVFTPAELAAITEIDCSSYDTPDEEKIFDLTGIEHFTALTELSCACNRLTELDLGKNPALTMLNTNFNLLTELDLSQNPALTELYCYVNELTKLNISQNAALTFLACTGNHLASLDVSRNTALTELACNENHLAELDVSHNTALTFLDCSDNHLTGLDVSHNTALTFLKCSNNHLTRLDVFQNTALTTLLCSRNRLTELDVNNNTALNDLSCFHNQLTSLFVGNNTALEYLNCSDNQLTSLFVGNNTLLDHFICDHNQRTVASGTELTAMDTSFLPIMASNIVGGSFDGGKVNFTADELTYDYDCGNGWTTLFNLVKAPTFEDVKPSDWFYNGAQYTTTRGLFKGISSTEFGPKLPMTRSMVVQVLYSMAGKPEVEKTAQFVDVKDSDWFADAVAWGVENGVTAGYPGGRFAPNDEVNREQLAVMLHGYMMKPAAYQPLTFADTNHISGWARDAVQWAVENVLMGGVPGNKILPQGLAERSQGAVIMMNFDQIPKL